ncbi:uncharacterized protein LAESUDRAFT_132833 [Laetiporus sulphureus 93-53]|uniref:Zn(2)-C6 fungal-type domain-containing protein n=1 Tax=Laetiporus sulphureus 93-53 TaxID=1314785 RepID=A0A165EI89_9APHY|nr:uncharacterized protein LAESUDRAFT_132833 [Laetiporus sulphureus 93-53]KZT07105.1 hypothetical protein LAESUDRAFT_132833 [Laetiporus sulphureus 93-53]
MLYRGLWSSTRSISTMSHNRKRDNDSAHSDAQLSGERSEGSGCPPTRRPACVQCKSLKIRCEFIPEENTCMRCKLNSHECILTGRKKRRPAPTHEDLVRRSQLQDQQIQTLLRQLDEMRALSKYRHLITEAEVEAAAMVPIDTDSIQRNATILRRSPPSYGVESADAFTIGCSTMLCRAPSSSITTGVHVGILKCGLFSPSDIDTLFSFYFNNLNPSVPLLDPVLHTPQRVLSSSPLLFTVIIAISSRFWTYRPRLHHLAMEYASDAAAEALREGRKTIETCQAYVLMAVFPGPVKKWSEGRGSLLAGLASRIAQDLQLDKAPPPSCSERERLNRMRTWLQVIGVDMSHCIQTGRKSLLNANDYIARTFPKSFKWSSVDHLSDIYLCACIDIGTLVTQFYHAIDSDQAQHGASIAAVLDYDQKLAKLASDWRQPTAEIAKTSLRLDVMVQLTANTLRMAILGVGIHLAEKLDASSSFDVLERSIQAGRAVIHLCVKVYPIERFPYAIEPQFFYLTLAAASLVRLLKARFNIDPILRTHVIEDVAMLIEHYKRVALDSTHVPAVHARFLTALLKSVTTSTANTETSTTVVDPSTRHNAPSNNPVMSTSQAAQRQAHAVDNLMAGHGAPSYAFPRQGFEFFFEHFASDMSTLDQSPDNYYNSAFTQVEMVDPVLWRDSQYHTGPPA